MSNSASTNNQLPIGVFDSGIGGLTVFSAIRKLLPQESLVYLGDTARVPYGAKSPSTIKRYAFQSVDFLLKHNIKAAVVACNTATAFAMDDLQRELEIPVIGVIEPGVRQALIKTKGKLGVIGTRGTIASEAYPRLIAQLQARVEVFAEACPLFVSLVEEGWQQQDAARLVVKTYLAPLKTKVDTLILGCTHYPLLSKLIQQEMGDKVSLIDSALATASSLQALLIKNNLCADGVGSSEFFVTDLSGRFKEIAQQFLGVDLPQINLAKLG